MVERLISVGDDLTLPDWVVIDPDNLDGLDAAVAAKVADGASAVRASLSSTFGRVFSPMAYGATGDGIADDTEAIQAALDDAVATDGGLLALPPGIFRTTAPITWTNPTPGIVSGPRITGAGRSRTTILADFDNGSVIDIMGCAPAPGSLLAFGYGGGIEHLRITQTIGRVGIVGIRAAGWWYAEVHHNQISGLSSDALLFPKRDDISANPDSYACAGWRIHSNDLSLNRGKGIHAPSGLGFAQPLIENNKIANNFSDGIWLGGHNSRIIGNGLVANGQYGSVTTGPASGLVVGWVQAVPNGLEVKLNEIQNNTTAGVQIIAAAGFSLQRNRFLSSVATLGGVTQLYPPLHVALGASPVQSVTDGDIQGNYHRSDVTGSYSLSLYKVAHASVKGHRIAGAIIPAGNNTAALVKYDGFNANHRSDILEGGRLVSPSPTTRYALMRLRSTATNVTGTPTTIGFDNEWLDPDNDDDPATGYTTPYTGVYDVDAVLTITGLASGNTVTMQFLVGGSVVKEYKMPAAGITDQTFSISAKLSAVAGSLVTIRASQNSGTDKAIKIGDSYNSLSIVGIR